MPDGRGRGRRAPGAQRDAVALVLSDVNMPGESGLDFRREVLAQHPDTAVVMVTGMDDRRFADVAIELGAYGYILKPFKPNELIINVGNALRRRALEIENRGHREQLEQTVLERTRRYATRSPNSRAPSGAAPPPRGDDPPALVRGRVPGPGDGRAHRAHEPLLLAARPARGARSRARRDDPHREPDARRRQDRHPGPDPAQAGAAHRRGARAEMEATPRSATASSPARASSCSTSRR